MKKIGILTLNGNNNYGNKLQNYALLSYLKNIGFDVETIWFKDNFKNYIKNTIKKYMPINNKYKRINKFDKFTIKYLNRVFYKNNKIENLYDYFIVGSDQVWNYNLDTFNDNYLLTFSKDKNKNISYSASFGLSNLDKNIEEKFINGLNNFKNISVREEKGKSIVEALINREDVQVLIDPTMLLSSEDWDKISKKPKQLKNINKKYILIYFLGRLSSDKRNIIEKFAKENDFDIIDVYDKNNSFYNIGPEEFLYLEKNASLICTDSFHSAVFAILYNRPFISFNRDEIGTEGMSSRLDTLLDKFNLSERKYSGDIDLNSLKINYVKTNEILSLERKKANLFLCEALNFKQS